MKPASYSPENPFRIGTRGSELALAQAREVRAKLMDHHGLGADAFQIEVIKTTGDIVLDRPLSEIGGKGLFTKEIEQALFEGRVDVAVHSSKDMQTVLPYGLSMEVFLPREDTRDVFLSEESASLKAIKKGAVIGSASLRRQAQLKRYRSDLEVIIFRGNVQTRLRKLKEKQADATLLAAAGLNRLGLQDLATEYLDIDAFLPACAQGAIGLETANDHEDARAFIAPLHDAKTAAAIVTERAFLRVLDGSCRTPIAGLAALDGDKITFRGEVLRPDGSESQSIVQEGLREDADKIGLEAGQRLKEKLSADFLASLEQ